jgi:hypothetical protein
MEVELANESALHIELGRMEQSGMKSQPQRLPDEVTVLYDPR